MMNSLLMSQEIISSLRGVDQPGGVHTMWNTICNHVESNCIVYYGWAGFTTTTPPTPDPTNLTGIFASVNTSMGRALVLPAFDQADTAAGAMTILTSAMNAAAMRWMVRFPVGFAVTPCFIIPSIVVTPSGADNQSEAMLSLCNDVIRGISLATPAMGGTHAAYTGTGFFSSIM